MHALAVTAMLCAMASDELNEHKARRVDREGLAGEGRCDPARP
ncbi:MAG TPA: hypothetical protein VI006_02175 [Solirubrobacteraceae bacterium]